VSCPRCGGVLETELAAAMTELVCGSIVIEGRYCHCGEGEDPADTKLPPKGGGTRDGQSQSPTPSEARTS
jgi:hypothetical protein